ncbi:MAG: DsbA family oxidoreductase [Candidatus Fonsibacter sp.]|jgi:predicted DsbA family dithiol-disulfide isomerase|nr:DsbA family oxidoreductase [Candidatus Fonsibacter sp.]
MKIKIFLDTICGWCYIGHKRLFNALAEFKDRKFEVEYAPFLLNPDMPLAGIKRSDYLVMKFGSKENAQPMYDRMTEQAKSENLNFKLNDIQITPSTILSHILIDLSKGMREQNSIVENIFKTYFIAAGNIGDPANLIAIGVKNGLKKEIIKEAFESKKKRDEILEKNQLAYTMGITGVPLVMFNDQVAVQGAENKDSIIEKIKRFN